MRIIYFTEDGEGSGEIVLTFFFFYVHENYLFLNLFSFRKIKMKTVHQTCWGQGQISEKITVFLSLFDRLMIIIFVKSRIMS